MCSLASKGLLTAAQVSGIGRYLVTVPEREQEEDQETSGPGGADFQDDQRDAEKGDRPGWPPFRLLIGGQNAERGRDEKPGQRRSLAKEQLRRGSGFGHLLKNIYIKCCYISTQNSMPVRSQQLGSSA